MNGTRTIVAAIIVALAPASIARAQARAGPEEELPDYFQQNVIAPRRALELSFGTGYTQGFGALPSRDGMSDIGTVAGTFDLGAGYRVDPHWAVSATGQFQELFADPGFGGRGLAAGLAGAYHFRPYVRTDPWVQLGVGYRLQWETRTATPTLVSHGFQLVRFTVGLDVRADEHIAVAPVLGAGVDVFLWHVDESLPSTDYPRVSTFVFMGVQMRFDIGASRARNGGERAAAR